MQKGIRACGKYATTWTLFSVAIRLGTALGLGQEDPELYSPFELECRRRLWHGIAVLDSQCTLDRGSAPLLLQASLGPPPMNINDSDLKKDADRLVDAEGYTDMTAPLLSIYAVLCQRQVFEAADGPDQWKRKLEAVEEYTQ
ncbi:MAG: fungal specific transcription factor domain-containing protein, partial [Terriglobus roseus]|nr:fungal specific transcription factor domain-containing protein [Terriglobus roseus]